MPFVSALYPEEFDTGFLHRFIGQFDLLVKPRIVGPALGQAPADFLSWLIDGNNRSVGLGKIGFCQGCAASQRGGAKHKQREDTNGELH